VFVSYVELHSHSAFSFLDGTSQPEELVAAAIERGHTALALTDHDTVSGSMEFAQAARGVGLRAIHGAEVTLSDGRHVTLLVRDTTGWANLSRLLARRVDGIFLADFEQGEIGPDLYRHACLLGLEGLVSKHRDRPYRAGRSPHWIKIKNRKHPAMSRVMDAFR